MWAAPGAQHTVDVWTTDQGGLPHSAVLAIIQTRDGYLWLGTPKGLARVDGVRFEKFNESNTPGLARRPAWCWSRGRARSPRWISDAREG